MKLHGYIFSIIFGITFSIYGWIALNLLQIPRDVPLNQVLGGWDILLFLLLLAFISVASYFSSIIISEAVKRLGGLAWRNFMGRRHNR